MFETHYFVSIETEDITSSCYVMEYLAGGTLHNHVKGNPEPIKQKLKYLIQVAEVCI